MLTQSTIEEIEHALFNIHVRNPVKLRSTTPGILMKCGLNNLPMYENPSHIRKNILTRQQATDLGLIIGKNDHYHGLGIEIYIKAIAALDDPIAILKSTKNNDYVIITEVTDINGNKIIIPININTTTRVNHINIKTNRIKSVYGKDNVYKYIQNELKKEKYLLLYTKKHRVRV